MDTELQRLFEDQLRDIYDAETRILEALPKKIELAQSTELKTRLESKKEDTEGHLQRLKEVFEKLDIEMKRNTCEATKGLIKEAEELLSDFKDSSAIDAAIICAGQKIEHYEIATYGCLCAWAKELGHSDASEVLHKSLKEEKYADESLTGTAYREANTAASH